jgi:hypothetical protein
VVFPAHRYEIVFLPAPWEGIIPLRETADPNVATIAFHAEMERLRADGATGELILINYQSRRKLMLRQPLRPTKERRVSRRAPQQVDEMDALLRRERDDQLANSLAFAGL